MAITVIKLDPKPNLGAAFGEGFQTGVGKGLDAKDRMDQMKELQKIITDREKAMLDLQGKQQLAHAKFVSDLQELAKQREIQNALMLRGAQAQNIQAASAGGQPINALDATGTDTTVSPTAPQDMAKALLNAPPDMVATAQAHVSGAEPGGIMQLPANTTALRTTPGGGTPTPIATGTDTTGAGQYMVAKYGKDGQIELATTAPGAGSFANIKTASDAAQKMGGGYFPIAGAELANLGGLAASDKQVVPSLNAQGGTDFTVVSKKTAQAVPVKTAGGQTVTATELAPDKAALRKIQKGQGVTSGEALAAGLAASGGNPAAVPGIVGTIQAAPGAQQPINHQEGVAAIQSAIKKGSTPDEVQNALIAGLPPLGDPRRDAAKTELYSRMADAISSPEFTNLIAGQTGKSIKEQNIISDKILSNLRAVLGVTPDALAAANTPNAGVIDKLLSTEAGNGKGYNEAIASLKATGNPRADTKYMETITRIRQKLLSGGLPQPLATELLNSLGWDNGYVVKPPANSPFTILSPTQRAELIRYIRGTPIAK